jgi:acetate kinase
MSVLVLNCGSSSVKFQLIDMKKQRVRLKGLVEKIGSSRAILTFTSERRKNSVRDVLEIPDHERAVRLILEILTDKERGVLTSMDEIVAVGHRTVHGGEEFSGSAMITPEVIAAMERCIPFAPLHNPANITGIQMARKLMPDIPQVAVFDTAFHSQMPEKSFLYGLPYEMYEKLGVRRYGFHGTSHRFVAESAATLLKRPLSELKIVTCHLGNGSSIAAVSSGISVDTSMGFTPLEGLLMGTRCGDLDPAIVGFIQSAEGLSSDDVDTLMNKRSGLLGLSGVSNDMRELEAEAGRGNRRAELALEIFCHRIRKYIASYAAVMGGVDAVVFTGGIGENSSYVREKSLVNMEWMGIELNSKANQGNAKKISTGTVSCLVLPTNEELAIAREAIQILERLDDPKSGTATDCINELTALTPADRRELVLLWAEDPRGSEATLAERFHHRLGRPFSTGAVHILLSELGLIEEQQ